MGVIGIEVMCEAPGVRGMRRAGGESRSLGITYDRGAERRLRKPQWGEEENLKTDARWRPKPSRLTKGKSTAPNGNVGRPEKLWEMWNQRKHVRM